MALLTEGRWTDGSSRIAFLLALGLGLAVGAAGLLGAADARRAREAAAPERALRQARDQQAATAEILGAMTVSPPDLQHVLDTVARNAMRVCDGFLAAVSRFDGQLIHLAAHHGIRPDTLEVLRRQYPCPPDDTSVVGRAIRQNELIHVADASRDSRMPALWRELPPSQRYRSLVVAPLPREGRALGALSVTRLEGEFSERQIQLLQTFAAQAVIAIENVRLFQELEARNRELTESLEQQTATSEILQVISSSPTDLGPVFDAILQNAVRLCDGFFSLLFRFDGERLDLAATYNVPVEGLRALRHRYPMPIASEEGGLTARAVRERRLLHVRDIQSDPSVPAATHLTSEAVGQRAAVAVPMFREGEPVGALTVSRQEAREFSEKELALLQTFAAQAVIAIENVRLFTALEARNRELTESLEQQTATSEILGVISSSPTDVQPVFDTIVKSAVRLCDALFAAVLFFDGEVLWHAADYNFTPEARDAMKRAFPMPAMHDNPSGRAILERRVINIPDVLADRSYRPALQSTLGYRSLLVAPMLREGTPIGVIVVTQGEVRPFSEKQVALLQTFAAQAVIAIENVRLFTALEARNRELTESLEQQTATAEILSVISRSPTDLQPVLEAVVRNASRLCGAANVSLYRVEGALMRKVAEQGPPLTALGVGEIRSITRTTISGRAIMDRATIHLTDHQSAEMVREYPDARRDTGIRTTIGIPLLREGVAIGAFTAYRLEPRPFSERELALLQTFAAQAVIAIENVRLFQELQARNRELTESLEQQTATGEILRVISSSPTELAPVMAAVTRNAARLARADHALIGEAAEGRIRWLATSGCPLVPEGPPISRQLPSGRAILDCRTTQVEDVTALTADFPGVRRAHDEFGVRTILATPLVREGQAIGVLLVRRTRVQSFTDTEIELLRTFAAQAVIAVENVRLFQELQARNRELTESLEQQTATSEILRAISSSPTDVQPVFDTIVGSVVRLCDGVFTTAFRFDGELIHPVAYHRNIGPAAQEVHECMYPRPPSADSVVARAILDRAVVHVLDVERDANVPAATRELAQAAGYRSILAVPMLREGNPIGALGIGRRELNGRPRPFSDREIALVRTFADQAVIAIENVRLFQELEARNRELTEALGQQTATSEILRVISSSPTDTQPVFETIARNAVRLCDAVYCAVFQVEGGQIDLVAYHNIPLEGIEALRQLYPAPVTTTTKAAWTARERVLLQIEDVESDPTGTEAARRLARIVGYRSQAFVPMLKGDQTLGVLTLSRREAGPFAEQHLDLLRTFADQAVIAIENVRLFRQLEARNRELTESLEQQTATAEILQAISSSPTNTQPVFDAIVASAVRLCDGRSSSLYRIEDDVIHQVAYVNPIEEAHSAYRTAYPKPLEHADPEIRRHYLEGTLAHVEDVDAEPGLSEEFRARARTSGYRSVVSVPMFREGRVIGTLAVARAGPHRSPRPFSDREIRLLQTFADQAVIAIENVRLFRELEARNRELTESLEQQTATAEILRAISSSPTDTQPVFDSIAQSAVRLCAGRDCFVWRFDGAFVDIVAHQGFSSDVLRGFRQMYPVPVDADTLSARSIRERAVVHRPDIPNDPDVSEFVRQISRMGGYRTGVVVPMLRSGEPIGAIGVTRGELSGGPRPFSDKEITLLQTFADQAVIAVENVRLFQELEARNRELSEALEQQTATAEILRAISGSPTDTQPVFDTIAQRAVRVCDGRQCTVYQLDGALVRFVAHHGLPPEALEVFQQTYPLTVDADTLAVRSIREGTVMHVQDLLTDPSQTSRRFGQTGGFRSAVVVPMLRSGRAVGAIGVGRSTPGGDPRPYTDKEIALLRTFADQGVIAIENVRLFQELQARTRQLARSVEELQALSEVGRAVSSTLDLPTVLATIVARAVQLSGTSSGVLYEYDEASETFHLRASHRAEEELVEALRASPIQLGQGATGRAVARRAPVEVTDILADQQFKPELRVILMRLGYRSFLSIPLLLEQRILGALTVSRREPGHFPADTVNLLQTFATQSALAIQNARLFREIEAKGRELEVASRHKSQFLANMSHELRTPLNAILGYTELLIDGIYGDLSAKAGDVMARIDRSGKHLLGLINDVLDLSKIEAGQLELALADYSLAEVVHAVVTQVESLAAEKALLLRAAVAPGLPPGRGDERRLAQVLLNLVGNALKFTEVGSVRIVAHLEGDAFVVSVADTGPGIAEADRQRIFEEFQQADSSSTRKKGGTGLGLSIARRIVELHGGRIWVESTVGRGSTFTFQVPVRVERQAARA